MYVCISSDIEIDEIKAAYPVGEEIELERTRYKVIGYLEKFGYNGIEIEPI